METLVALINPTISEKHEYFKLFALAEIKKGKVMNIEFTMFKRS